MAVEGTKQKIRARKYRGLTVWQEAIQLAKAVYELTKRLARLEMHALSDQIRRAAISVPSNTAEGQTRKAPCDFSRFLHIALGSLDEMNTQLVLACELDYPAGQDTMAIHVHIPELRKKMCGPINSLPGIR